MIVTDVSPKRDRRFTASVAAVQAMGRAFKTMRFVPPATFLKAHKGIAAYLEPYVEATMPDGSRILDGAIVWDMRGNPLPIASLSEGVFDLIDAEAHNDIVDAGSEINEEADTIVEIYGRSKYVNQDEDSRSDSKGRMGSAGERAGGQGDRGGERGVRPGQEGRLEVQGQGLPLGPVQQDGSLEEDLDGQSAWLTEQANKRGFKSIDDMLAFFQLAEQWRNDNPADVLHVEGLYGYDVACCTIKQTASCSLARQRMVHSS